ncbi:hypothetical protein J0X19_21985 [Hymenobacter sp. BT186]|uniref:Uncharacterized protein n=1 Tax=Hymenobacter telluris TaxID=2816474 RepID=A0A939F0S5_9BACT|nr:hypothetical protein [Hymenobacter telluris]MBO0360646.1 hypothetical protein [Hymenobacter telluris]MBW3376673.1 hypothetical protein [Hymenobacter norwichensis]
MAEYHVTADDTRCFRLREGARLVGQLTYPSWFSFEATLTLATEPTPFAVQPKGFWGTTIELRQHDTTLLRFKMGWNGNIILQSTFPGHAPQDFVFRQKGLFKSHYLLTDAEGQELLVVQPDFKWSKFTYEFALTSTAALETHPSKDVLLLLAVHCANYYITMMSAAA